MAGLTEPPLTTHALSLAAGTVPECEPEAVADAAARAEFRHAGFTIDPAAWNDRRSEALRRRLSDLAARERMAIDALVRHPLVQTVSQTQEGTQLLPPQSQMEQFLQSGDLRI